MANLTRKYLVCRIHGIDISSGAYSQHIPSLSKGKPEKGEKYRESEPIAAIEATVYLHYVRSTIQNAPRNFGIKMMIEIGLHRLQTDTNETIFGISMICEYE